VITTTSDENTFGREVTIEGFALTPGATAKVQVEASGVVSFASSVVQTSYDIVLRQAGMVSSAFMGEGPAMDAGDVHGIHLNWSNPVTATIEIDHGGDGDVDETRVLQNQIRALYLPLISRR
jgi:hypothetical protein